MMMKLLILSCAEKLELVLSTAPKTWDNTDKDSKIIIKAIIHRRTPTFVQPMSRTTTGRMPQTPVWVATAPIPGRSPALKPWVCLWAFLCLTLIIYIDIYYCCYFGWAIFTRSAVDSKVKVSLDSHNVMSFSVNKVWAFLYSQNAGRFSRCTNYISVGLFPEECGFSGLVFFQPFSRFHYGMGRESNGSDRKVRAKRIC